MIIHPELRALRADDGPQRAAQDALVARVSLWREQPVIVALIDAVKVFASHGWGETPAVLTCLFGADDSPARELADELIRVVAGALGDNPLGHVPFRHFGDDTIATLQLAKAGDATLSLVAIDGAGLARRAAATTADSRQARCGSASLRAMRAPP